MLVALAKMIDPNGRINNNHNYFLADLRLGAAFNPFSDPPSLESRLLLSRAIKASRPSLTRAVFSEIPVRLEAFSIILSSIFSVVLMCIMMHHLCIYVNFYFGLNGYLLEPIDEIAEQTDAEAGAAGIAVGTRLFLIGRAGNVDMRPAGTLGKTRQK